jgi:hypothetical protein
LDITPRVRGTSLPSSCMLAFDASRLHQFPFFA